MRSTPLLVIVVVVPLALASLLARGGESAEQSEFVGAAMCAQCHPGEYEAWQKSGHARALERLSAQEQQDPRCRQCHTTSPEETDPALAGVQCEACHGRGRYYATKMIMKDTELRERLFLEKGGPATCARCHNDSSPSLRPFVYEEAMKAIHHGKVSAPASASADGGAP